MYQYVYMFVKIRYIYFALFKIWKVIWCLFSPTLLSICWSLYISSSFVSKIYWKIFCTLSLSLSLSADLFISLHLFVSLFVLSASVDLYIVHLSCSLKFWNPFLYVLSLSLWSLSINLSCSVVMYPSGENCGCLEKGTPPRSSSAVPFFFFFCL